MNLKEQMMNEYQKKDSEKIKDAIAEEMKKRPQRSFLWQRRNHR